MYKIYNNDKICVTFCLIVLSHFIQQSLVGEMFKTRYVSKCKM